MLKGIKVKIYPNQTQTQQIEQNIGNHPLRMESNVEYVEHSLSKQSQPADT